MKKTNKKMVFFFGIVTLICLILLGIGGCKQEIVPDAIIKVSNECGLAIDVFINGVFHFSVENEAISSIEDLEDGQYDLEARRKGTGEFVANVTLDVIFNRIYTWSVLSSARVKVINRYGETLSIYGDDIYLGDVVDQADSTMDNVPYGDRKLEAKTSDNTIVATTTISVLTDNTYEWTINK